MTPARLTEIRESWERMSDALRTTTDHEARDALAWRIVVLALEVVPELLDALEPPLRHAVTRHGLPSICDPKTGHLGRPINRGETPHDGHITSAHDADLNLESEHLR